MRAEAAKRDHRYSFYSCNVVLCCMPGLTRIYSVIGRAQSLFMFHPYAQGSPFFLPHGTRVYNKLLNFMRDEYRKRGYQVRLVQIVCFPFL